ncbi:MAG: polyphosphate:AMP phosphotransferase [Jaaginema sp. PMC 1079.18]|nr:polyphosphate:AMP phosphotransferase [Jaaginema sp. PMC 1080.18]MEC4849417.1 polyphosphate:AMP phosphotransferase [Jaaginema sp. PMC 1079.18]MEC4864951.1 polyphosphate:AMP phosphotransferase [Jaaginema sp. PMC 1078.18]
MLDFLNLDVGLDKATYKVKIEELMLQLRSLQRQCREQGLPVVIVLEGWAAAGKGALIKKMINYMDPRGFTVHPTLAPSPLEQRYPFLWRFWQKLPSHGSIAIFYHSWYTHILEDRLFERLTGADVSVAMAQINAFERQLVDDGVAIAKFYIHLSRKELKKRLKDSAGDELTAWRVRPEDWQQAKRYKEYSTLVEDMLMHNSTGVAPWTLVEGNDRRWVQVKVLSQLVATLTAALDRKALQQQQVRFQSTPQAALLPTEPDFLAQVDLSLQLDRETYKEKLRNAQIKLLKLQRSIYEQKIPVLLLFEGWDAAGKGGAIKRLTDVLDPRSYQVNTYAAPSTEEKLHHYLWRFWRHLPEGGKIGIFDRSWYGRVLVERVENFATELEWRRAYQEINEFENQLKTAGYVLVKFWIHISPAEQLRRFEKRQSDPFKAYKLTEEDWRNREKWPFYNVAVNQAIARTNTPHAPWTIIPGNNKYYARVKVIETVIQAIEKEINRHQK